MIARRKLIDQVEAGKVKARDAQRALKAKASAEKGVDFSKYPATIKEFLDSQLKLFQESNVDYKKIDRDIGDALHQHYLLKLHPEKTEDERRNAITNEIFKILDESLQGKLSPNDAKNYKKLLSAL